jgi:hypothetical protein
VADSGQPRYYEHILREAEDFESVAFYIWTNPARAGILRAGD